jgi:hydroxymethylglutaryl-CoA lyase
MHLPSAAQLTEVGPRDGLQNEPRNLPTADKIGFITRLAAAGLDEIEVTSFVSPTLVPNLADAAEVMAAARGLRIKPFALILNAKGYDRAREAGARFLTVTLSLTDSHNRRNANRTTGESVRELKPLGGRAKADGVTARVAVSTAFGCPFEGVTDLSKLVALVAEMVEGGFDRIVLCDTIGIADPKQVYDWSRRCLAEFPGVHFALHLHDTYGRGLANILGGLEAGITRFDTAIGGLGGCPFAPGATGNVATEDVVALFDRMGIATGVDLDRASRVAIEMLAALEQPRRSHLSQVEVAAG